MTNNSSKIKDNFGRQHTYLRISLTEKCNLRCTYCMPEEGGKLSPKSHIMHTGEILSIAKEFVDLGINKIRLTGGEPLVKKSIDRILRGLANLNVELSITTNGVILDRHLPLLKETGVKKLNISIDTLKREKFEVITRRDKFQEVMAIIEKVQVDPFFTVKLNAVLIKGFNDDEIIDFISLTKNKHVAMRFIEFMPFDGNQWKMDKLVPQDEILKIAQVHFGAQNLIRLEDQKNDTSRNYKIKGHQGSFAIISTVTNPFCDSCNRIRLMANGSIKNCLFSANEVDLLTPFREGKDIKPYIFKHFLDKKQSRGGLSTDEDFLDPDKHNNRSMIMIGG